MYKYTKRHYFLSNSLFAGNSKNMLITNAKPNSLLKTLTEIICPLNECLVFIHKTLILKILHKFKSEIKSASTTMMEY